MLSTIRKNLLTFQIEDVIIYYVFPENAVLDVSFTWDVLEILFIFRKDYKHGDLLYIF